MQISSTAISPAKCNLGMLIVRVAAVSIQCIVMTFWLFERQTDCWKAWLRKIMAVLQLLAFVRGCLARRRASFTVEPAYPDMAAKPFDPCDAGALRRCGWHRQVRSNSQSSRSLAPVLRMSFLCGVVDYINHFFLLFLGFRVLQLGDGALSHALCASTVVLCFVLGFP